MNIIDLTKRKQFGYSTKFDYLNFEVYLAQYAVTKMSEKALAIGNSEGLSSDPSIMVTQTDVEDQTKMYANIAALFPEGVVSAVFIPQQMHYVVNFLSDTKKGLNALVSSYSRILEQSNFYQGKCLHFSKTNVDFVRKPTITLNDVVLLKKIMKEVKLNVLDFLTTPKLYAVTKQRGIVLYGPPGTGKCLGKGTPVLMHDGSIKKV